MKILFITGIDTGIGKTHATGWLAGLLRRQGTSLTTLKLVQTGQAQISEDIELHRRMMGAPLDTWDRRGLTCPYRFDYPASPHLAAQLEGRRVDPAVIDQAVAALAPHFDLLLMEGVGGLAVPLDRTYTVLDFIAQRRYPCLVVTAPRLGSINHTLLTVEALQARGVAVSALLYNLFFQAAPEILEDTRRVFHRFFPGIPVIDLPALTPPAAAPDADEQVVNAPDLQKIILGDDFQPKR